VLFPLFAQLRISGSAAVGLVPLAVTESDPKFCTAYAKRNRREQQGKLVSSGEQQKLAGGRGNSFVCYFATQFCNF
jgi:hypothetical protein